MPSSLETGAERCIKTKGLGNLEIVIQYLFLFVSAELHTEQKNFALQKYAIILQEVTKTRLYEI